MANGFKRYQSPGGRAYEAPADATIDELRQIESILDAEGTAPTPSARPRQQVQPKPTERRETIGQRGVSEAPLLTREPSEFAVRGRVVEPERTMPPHTLPAESGGRVDPGLQRFRERARLSEQGGVVQPITPPPPLGTSDILQAGKTALEFGLPFALPAAGTFGAARLLRLLPLGERALRVGTPLAEGAGGLAGLEAGARLGITPEPTTIERIVTAVAPAAGRAAIAGAVAGAKTAATRFAPGAINQEAIRRAREIASKFEPASEPGLAYDQARQLAATAGDMPLQAGVRGTIQQASQELARTPGISGVRAGLRRRLAALERFIAGRDALPADEVMALKADINAAIREEMNEKVKGLLFQLRKGLLTDADEQAGKNPAFRLFFNKIREADKLEMRDIATKRLQAYLQVPGQPQPPDLPKLTSAIQQVGDELQINVNTLRKRVAADRTLQRVLGDQEYRGLLQSLQQIEETPVIRPRAGANVGSFRKVDPAIFKLAIGALVGGSAGVEAGAATVVALNAITMALTSQTGQRAIVKAFRTNPGRVLDSVALGTIIQAATQAVAAPLSQAQPRFR